MSQWIRFACGFLLGLMYVSSTSAEETEVQRLLKKLLAAPTIQTEAGFTAKLLVPPGQLYDPLFMRPQGNAVWLNDDGGEEKETGSRLLSLDPQGKITILAGLGKLLPVVGFDIAPEGFGSFGGQIFTLAQAKVKVEGAFANHIIQRVDPTQDYTASVFCPVPSAGTVNTGTSGAGVEARFGPPGSPFANKFYALTAFNNTIYQVTADGQCTPFVTLEGAPFGLVFPADGKSMLVSVSRGGLADMSKGGAIVRVSPDGKVDEKPVATAPTALTGMDFAPEGFGAHAGHLFVAELGSMQSPVPMTQTLPADGKVHRVTPEGQLQRVASGLINPLGVHFVNKKLWVSDVNGDFIGGMRELPDGFLVEIRVAVATARKESRAVARYRSRLTRQCIGERRTLLGP